MPWPFSAKRAYEPLPLLPAIEMDNIGNPYYYPPAESPERDVDREPTVAQLNANRKAALAEIDSAPFS